MIRLISILSIIILCNFSKAQKFSGEIYLKDQSSLYLNQVYVTNLNTQKTVLSFGSGNFNIDARPGDIIRFTSIITERKDILLTPKLLSYTNHLIELKIEYTDIREVVISNFKPSGNLRKDIASIKIKDKKEELQKAIGLPKPKGDGTPPVLPIAALAGGGLTFSVDAIYDLLSGDRKKKERLYHYEKMNISITRMKNYFGKAYFQEIKIPENLIDNFLQFVYSSDNLSPLMESNNIEGTKIYIEKYLPIYQKRLRTSNLYNILAKD